MCLFIVISSYSLPWLISIFKAVLKHYVIFYMYEGKSISKLQIVIEKRRMGIMTYKLHLFFNVISKQI